MSDNVIQGEGSAIQAPSQEPVYTQAQLNAIVSDRVNREKAKSQRENEQQLHSEPFKGFDKEMLLQEAKQAAKAELQAEMQRISREQEEARWNTQFAKDKEQYRSHVSGITLPDDEDQCGLFKPEGEKKYLPLQIVAGNLNFESTPEIMKELARNPHKLVAANVAAASGDIQAVKAMFKTISASIKENQQALESRKNASQPLTHLKPSGGGSSNRTPTLDDYRNDRSLYV